MSVGRYDAEGLAAEQSAVLAALYLRGLPRPIPVDRRSWRTVWRLLRLHEAGMGDAVQILDSAGFGLESLALQSVELLDRAARCIRDRRAITAANPFYPRRWLEALGAQAPPALWWNGVPFANRPGVTVVGSRSISRAVGEWCARIGAVANESGYLVVSGGAAGCDRAGVRGAWRAALEGEEEASPSVEILPAGLARSPARRGALLSVCEPDAEFCSAAAMERNVLLYAWSEASIVGSARLREGGTWHGASEALRRRVSTLFVRDADEPGLLGLRALGAEPIADARELPSALRRAATRGGLDFGPAIRYG